MNVYDFCPEYQKNNITLRKVQLSDAEGLLTCYSDTDAVPLFNSDNCDGDDFHYYNIERMEQAIEFWIDHYNRRDFCRWTVLYCDQIVGTVECFDRGNNPMIGSHGILRIDCETRLIIGDILDIADREFYNLFNIKCLLTKAVPMATERRNALSENDYFSVYDGVLPYEDYFMRTDALAY